MDFFFGIGFILFDIICFLIFSCYYLSQIRIQIFKLVPNEKKLLIKAMTKMNLKNNKERKITSQKNYNNHSRNNSSIPLKSNKNEKIANLNKNKFTSLIKTNKDTDNIFLKFHKMPIKKFGEVEEKDLNLLPYCKALVMDKRHFFSIFFSILKMKIDIISIIFFPEEFTHRSLTLSIYLFEFLFSFFINALLYTDEIVSKKYHNNGQLDFWTTIFLALASNLISCIIIFYIKEIANYREYLSRMVRDVKK